MVLPDLHAAGAHPPDVLLSLFARVAPAFDVWRDLEIFLRDYVSGKTKLTPGK